MLSKIAFRNVRRQIGNYLIYFITVTLTVALMFAINNVIFSEQLKRFSVSISHMSAGLLTLSIIIALIVAFVLGYATSFMLKLRKREFGTYLTLGMTRRNILTIFILEMTLMGLAALGIGIFLGLFIYQGLMMIMCSLMEMQIAIAAYSLKALIFTIIIVIGIFLLSSLTSALYLKRVSIYKLIHENKVASGRVRHPIIWFIITLLSLALIVSCCIVFYNAMIDALKNGNGSTAPIYYSLLGLCVGVVTFHIGLARSLVNILVKNRRFYASGTNTFTLRQLSGRLKTNSLMAGILAFLISFAVIGANVSFVQKTSERVGLDKYYPYDISLISDPESLSPITKQEGEKIINQFCEIENSITYNVYTNNQSYLHNFTIWSSENGFSLTDSFITESDFNKIITGLGYEPVDLDGKFLIVTDMPQVAGFDFSKAVLKSGGESYSFGGLEQNYPSIYNSYFFAVVDDKFVKGMDIETSCTVYNLKDEKFDSAAMVEALSYDEAEIFDGETIFYSQCDYNVKEYARIQRNSVTAILVVGALYIAVVFVFMAMAVLALKVLAGLSDDKQKYRILYRLGASQKEQCRTLFWQTFSFFFLPFALPMLLSVPTAVICGKMMELAGFAQQRLEIYISCALIALVMIAIYILYFLATYIISKNNVICNDAN